ncbi:MAG: (d)CMP kinase [Anaerolineales bacterium]|nr:(d)CMP kinase [Anaerolineales bacterium]MCB0006773.1 (d)CMP kinase [Anaerolineales bacterium]MCB0013296.1 (d)CMP kinase [Anaerolineales bacterium]MCB0019785.1 (d)CMP kinase [Anaerolineales bacterium]MCB0028684.1 (d)CMP kinase [Anaerolineales bacterium]
MSIDYQPVAIAIDGPAASGKTTVGRLLAEKLHYLFLDTGSMYRAATLAMLKHNVDVDDEAAVVQLTRAMDMTIKPVDAAHDDGRSYTVLLGSEDVTWELYTPQVEAHVSQVSTYPEVRAELVRRQREIGHEGNVVMVGRDIGTVVLPEAALKLYISASAEERARRRWKERQERGSRESYEMILADVVRRDTIDSSREHAPLRAARDAIIIDTTGRSIDDILAEIMEYVTLQP